MYIIGKGVHDCTLPHYNELRWEHDYETKMLLHDTMITLQI